MITQILVNLCVCLFQSLFHEEKTRKMTKIKLDAFFGATSISDGVNLSQSFRQDVFTPKDLDVSYTNLNYWDKQGILSSNRKGETSWRNFNFIDYVWIRVISELRNVGAPVELIREWKNQLFSGVTTNSSFLEQLKASEKELKSALNFGEKVNRMVIDEIKSWKKFDQKMAKKNGLTYFTYIIVYAISTRSHVAIHFFSDGGTSLWFENLTNTTNQEYLKRLNTQTHIRVSISSIISDFLLDERSTFLMEQIPILNASEIRLLDIINSGKYETVKINFKDKKIESVEYTQKQCSRKKIVEIINENKYQNIEIKVHKGMVTTIENTTKEYL